MRNLMLVFTLFFTSYSSIFSQSIDEVFSVKKMKKDFKVYKNIRQKANSGLYKYRTKQEIDSMYNWASLQIEQSKTHRDFFNIICQLSDFEGSTHNSVKLSNKIWKSILNEQEGYFPYPIKLVEDKWILNFETAEIPLGSKILSINGQKTKEIIKELYKYYETDGFNITGKRIGIDYNFSRYYRLHFGLQNSFEVVFQFPKSLEKQTKTLKSIGIKDYYKNVGNRHSKPFDFLDYDDSKVLYDYQKIDSDTGKLSIHSFAIGDNEESSEHIQFVHFLDSTFTNIKKNNIQNLIIDIRHNGGGSDPNDLVVYEYLTQRNFSENKSAWISFNKIPYIRYIETKVPTFLRFLGVIKYNRELRKEFPLEKDGKFYQDETSYDHIVRKPNKNAFTGNIYLLISARVASAGSNFGSLVASNQNVTIIGEETQGGYYGHNGHHQMDYILPNSKIRTTFSIVNLEQDSIEKENQPFGRGVMPDYEVAQTFDDYINHIDTQMNFTLDLLKRKNN